MKILTVQYKPIPLKINSNIKKFERIIRADIHLKPDLIIFPEYALTGPLYGHYDLAIKKGSEVYKKLKGLAKKYSIHLIPGAFIRKVGDKRYNSSCLINDKGKNLGFYDKQLLWGSEKRFMEPGKKSKVFKTRFGRIAIQICADLNSRKISADYFHLEPHIIINPTFWSQQDKKACFKKVPSSIEYNQVNILSKARAIEAKSYYVFCNYAGKSKIVCKSGRKFTFSSIGNSMIVDPYGQVVAKASSNRQEILFANLNLRSCHWFKYQSP